jgi:hypothetical protein
MGTVESLGEYPRHGGFTDAAWPDEEIGISDAISFYGIAQSFYNMLLTDDIIESHRTIFQWQ